MQFSSLFFKEIAPDLPRSHHASLMPERAFQTHPRSETAPLLKPAASSLARAIVPRAKSRIAGPRPLQWSLRHHHAGNRPCSVDKYTAIVQSPRTIPRGDSFVHARVRRLTLLLRPDSTQATLQVSACRCATLLRTQQPAHARSAIARMGVIDQALKFARVQSRCRCQRSAFCERAQVSSRTSAWARCFLVAAGLNGHADQIDSLKFLRWNVGGNAADAPIADSLGIVG